MGAIIAAIPFIIVLMASNVYYELKVSKKIALEDARTSTKANGKN